MQKANDQWLAERILENDLKAFGVLVERFQKSVYQTAYGVLFNRTEAEDVTQTVLLRAFQRMSTFRVGMSMSAWISKIALNEAIDRKRLASRTESLAEEPLDDAVPEPDHENDERRRHVHRALNSLSADQRDVVMLRHFADLSYDDMAAVLDLPVKTVKSRLYTARQQLKARLSGMEND